ncbi:hypothetical protein JCM24511_06237 [Saitozyma sp. JCM 24511]|nr:hypothetical protein JCM24511_06237 [Saitozyma sp. JCM 24511]
MPDDPPPAKGTTNPLFGATPAPDPDVDAATSSPPAAEPSQSSSPPPGTGNPLFGATPGQDNQSELDGMADSAGAKESVKGRVEASSRERVRDLKAAREAALGTATSSSSRMTVSQPPPIPSRPSSAPTPSRPSSLPAYLRKLGYLLSLLLGTSAAVAGVWSYFLLPLLHASFSARRALVEQQRTRLEDVLSRLRKMRGSALYPAASTSGEETIEDSPPHQVHDVHDALGQSKHVTFEELASTTSSDNGLETSASAPPSNLLPKLQPLTSSLHTLASTRTNTSTTRTSLLSTLESYTSHLHRQLWAPRPGHATFGGVGMNSLSANLAREGGGAVLGGGGTYEGSAPGIEARGEEWDAVRREIRAIKGMLLNRRNFTPTSTAS